MTAITHMDGNDWLRGTELSPADRNDVLSFYVHRYTGSHTPDWAKELRSDGVPYPLPFFDDVDWLANTWFAVRHDGSLNRVSRSMMACPTWPNDPRLRGDAYLHQSARAAIAKAHHDPATNR